MELFVGFLGDAKTTPFLYTNALDSFYEALLIPFEISAFTLVLSFWSETVTEPGPVAGICAAVIIIYGYHSPTSLISVP